MKKLTLVRVEWSEHRERLKPNIDDIGNKANDPELYTHIDKACSNEWAFLFLAPDGFVVLRPRHQRTIDFIEVLVAYCSGGNAFQKYLSNLLFLAQLGKATHLQFLTARKGLNKVAPKHGWRLFGMHRNKYIWRIDIKGAHHGRQ
jgi:hypothetical protein